MVLENKKKCCDDCQCESLNEIVEDNKSNETINEQKNKDKKVEDNNHNR